MTFAEAIERKKSLPKSIVKDDFELFIIVVPDLREDALRYEASLNSFKDVDDVAAILFSSNGKFLLEAACHYNGAILWETV